MNEQKSQIVLATAAANWTLIAGRSAAGVVLETTLQRATDAAAEKSFVEEIRVEPPRAWKPGTVLIGKSRQRLSELKSGTSTIEDSSGVKWEVSQQVTRESWTVILNNKTPETALSADWMLELAIFLDKPQAESNGNAAITIDGLRQTLPFSVPDPTPSRPWIVRLESDPSDTNALARGQEILLRWEVQNIEGNAELRGSLPGANTIRMINGSTGQRSIRALGESVYTLTAHVIENGRQTEIIRRIQVNLAAAQSGVDLSFLPAAVFPGGPIVCYRSAYNVKKINFTRVGNEPSLATHNYLGNETNIIDTFVIPHGPPEGESWTFGAIYASTDSEKSVHSDRIAGVAPALVQDGTFFNLPVSFGAGESPGARGLAAGTFVVTTDGPHAQVAKREWIAVARPAGLDLWVRDPSIGEVKAVANVQGRDWKNNWLNDALSGDFLGVGAANDSQVPGTQIVVAIRKVAGRQNFAEIIEIDLPLREDNPFRRVLTISDRRFSQQTVRVFSLGGRVFLLGDGAAISYQRNTRISTFRDEPRLAMVAFPEWEVATIAANGGAKISGYVFALDKKSSHLLRFDVQDDTVMAPRMAASGNFKVARLDKLQAAQTSLSPSPPPFPRNELEEGRAYTGKNADGTITQFLNPLDESSSLIAMGGVLLARSEVIDPSVGKVIQDRAYDPRLDVWTRCGHPFGKVTRDTNKFFATTPTTLYCLAEDSLLYVEGSLPSYLGFMSSDYAPAPAESLEAPPWPQSFTFPIIDNQTPLQLQWLDGRMDSSIFDAGRLRLALLDKGQTAISFDVKVNRDSGMIDDACATVDTTGREVAICQRNGHALTIAPARYSLQITMDSTLVLPYSYSISTNWLDTIEGESWTGQTLDIPSLNGEAQCRITFKYLAGDAKKSTLDAQMNVVLVNAAVADIRWKGHHAALFYAEVGDGHVIRLTLDKQPRG